MNIDFADDNSPAGTWWREGDPPKIPEQPLPDPEPIPDFSRELQVFQNFNEEPPEPIDIYDPDNEAQHDALLAGLTNVAYSTARTPITRPVRNSRERNPFFYFRTKSFSEDVEERKESIEPQAAALEHIDAEVEERLKTYQKELQVALEKNIATIREFFLTEVDPLSLGIQGGTAQVVSLMGRIFPDGVDTEQFGQFVHMAKQARKIKMANFIARYMGLDAIEAERIADSLTPRKEVMVIGPTPDERMQQPGPQPEKKPRLRERISAAGERERIATNNLSARAPRGG